MRYVSTLVSVMLICSMSAAFADEPGSVADLAWMSGCWASVDGEDGSGENWTIPAGGTLLGVNRTVRNSETIAFEYMQIRETKEQTIEFHFERTTCGQVSIKSKLTAILGFR